VGTVPRNRADKRLPTLDDVLVVDFVLEVVVGLVAMVEVPINMAENLLPTLGRRSCESDSILSKLFKII
jgi:hypothetical protein